jgi:hypothetical protein
MPESADSEVVQKTTETTGITVANLEQSASTSSAAILSNAVDDDLLSQLLKRIDQAELRVLSLQDSFKDDPVDRKKRSFAKESLQFNICYSSS